MCDIQYHMEALRKQAVIDRKKAIEARQQANMQPQFDPTGRAENTTYCAGPHQRRSVSQQPKFRLSDEGQPNRYRVGDKFYPHMEPIYPVMYNGTDNPDYIRDENRNNRRENTMISRHEARRKVNGDFDMKVHLECMPTALD